ncbi:hypothetical protein VBD025_06990 [Virgibacillus flavescens]|uniref:hypothetical protein n=1 Tax=Virgibacillus flavescens TaxID=1611422 RepID=UPI003D338BE0
MKKLEAYYRTESNAETAKAKLETLKVENVFVERIPEMERSGLMDIIKDMFTDKMKDNHDPQVLYADVAEADFAEATRIVKESEGHVSMK